HRMSYAQHLLEVLSEKDREIASLLRQNREDERHIGTWLEPEITRRHEELAGLRARVGKVQTERTRQEGEDALAGHVAGLERALTDERNQLRLTETELARTCQEVAALRSSKSWKLTAPLRAVQTWLQHLLRAG